MITLAAIQELTTRVREFPGEAMVSRSTAESYFLQFPHKKATRFHKRSRSEEDNNLCHITTGGILLQTCYKSVLAYNQSVQTILEKLTPPIEFTTLQED